jgi:malonyl CoA-acyl carrier protein transacylase
MTATLSAAQSRSAPPQTGWDCEVVILRGDNRAHLREQTLALAGFVERGREIHLPDLAATLATKLQPGGTRLAIVAASPSDLLTRLRRAADRLADSNCKQIRDSGGIYFFNQPLSAQGTVALLFPGEGGQYLDMLADLCGVFPEVEETFAWCDRLAADAGRPEVSLRKTLHLPPDSSPTEREAAEAELRKLGSSIFGVLVADQAIYRVLQNLRLPVSAIAGHSAGEIAALLVSGAMSSQSQHGSQLVEIMEIMQRQEEEAGGPDVALLAVGAGRSAVEQAATAAAGGAVSVAMDNCPHQCVAVGPAHQVAAVESALHERGVMCERLPFRRPYHTPLFEPWMKPFRDHFARVPFGPPHTLVYCCSTGELFPDDPDVVRQLAVNHWVNPVEFTRMIETMYADGVRVFVESGPRGNLSAFVEDILRGRPFAAIPANLPRKSGPTQINHMVAQLVAHNVPLNLGHLYAGRETRTVEWETRTVTSAPPSESARTENQVNRLSPPQPPSPAQQESLTGQTRSGEGVVDGLPYLAEQGDAQGQSPQAAAIMHSYLSAMEQFLDLQREVMEAFLSGQAPGGFLAEAELGAVLPFSSESENLPQPHPQPEELRTPDYCLMGRIERLEPGREVVLRRIMDEREDLYADDHTLGGRGVSRVDPKQNGLPVLPMTFSLEAMGEAASLLAPGKVVVAIRNIRLYRWLPFDADPTTLEVRAAVASIDPNTGIVQVKADVRDLGNSFLPDGANKVACEAVVLLADRYPDPPAPLAFRLTDEKPCRSTVEDLRRNMFHGPLFQMLRSLGRCGREGIEGTLEVQPRDRWFQSDSDPQVVVDPVLVDSAMHLLGAWHLEQPDWSGRILLPIGVSAVEFFGPIPPIGSHLVVRGHNEHETARQARHGVEVFAPDGRLWMRMAGAAYWRFYLPFGDVNFFGPKDQYCLSSRCTEAEPRSIPAARCYFLDPPLDLQQPVLRASGVRVTMTPREIAEFNGWAGTDAERSNWFFSRMVAKDAARAVWNARYGGGVFPADIEAEKVEGRVFCRPRDGSIAEPFPPVAVASVNGKVAAFAAFAPAVGIGLLTLPKNAGPDAERDARTRAASLAVADALRIDVMAIAPPTLDPADGSAVVTVTRGMVAHDPDQTGRVLVQTARQKDMLIATAVYEVGLA